jgi:ribosomal protein S4
VIFVKYRALYQKWKERTKTRSNEGENLREKKKDKTGDALTTNSFH